MAYVGAEISEEQKENWEQYREKAGHNSMSELIRTAVRKEIMREGEGSGISRAVENQIGEIEDTQQHLRDQVEELLDGFEEIQKATNRYPEETIDLAHEIADELEEVHEDFFEEGRAQIRDDLIALGREVSDSGEKYPYPPGQVENALRFLEENISYIKSVPKSPDDYYRVTRRERQ